MSDLDLTSDALDSRPSDDMVLPGSDDVRDPYPMLAEMRRATPVLHLTDLKPTGALEGRDMIALYRFDDVVSVLKDGHNFSSTLVGQMMGPVMGRTILEMGGDEHHRTRGLVAQAFRPKVLALWEDTLIRPLAHQLVDRFATRGSADLVRDFTFHFPARVIARILGLPETDVPQFQRWAIAIIAFAAHVHEGVAASKELRAYLAPILAERRDTPGDDLISELLKAELDGHRLDDEEIYPFLLLLLPAGIETTFRALGNLVYALLTHRDQLDAVSADRSLIPQAVEEGLRWEPPLLMLAREAEVACPVGGVEVAPGTQIAICQGAANRDDTHWERPDEFDIFRAPKQHLTFGSGPHMCLGTHLARLEMRVALDTLLDRLPDLELDPGDTDPHIRGSVFRSPTALPVRFTPEGS